MKIIKVTIARSKDFFGAHSENVKGLNGGGETIEDVKKSLLECIEIVKTFDDKNIPAALKGEYEIEWKLDVGSFLTYYKGIFSQSGIARLTGINEKQLNHYASGLKKPRPAQAKKIEAALHRLGSELLAVEL
ncbi:type II toxin-antitoxin system HicB family antitoxin [Dyadobacter sp. LJ53]|uniref:type II toxin-antitoxin system HicB family antitoxin n=1 Tax=Dyadobacter chenwenxiniae TaxID=2906456 RepID=UPI001F44D657|nr:type II toxin-antitoxin system HicB family antitoxin [Dyadobacter chenwenxiniae]MCF0052007.1 type II toxin-antitoxin system HicB family antitoxin [Dyadobacter chenwenxiniae]